jgi:hypothetical protein
MPAPPSKLSGFQIDHLRRRNEREKKADRNFASPEISRFTSQATHA